MSKQDTLAREQVSTQGRLARQRVSTQGMLARQHVSTQGTFAREHVFTTEGTQFSRLINICIKTDGGKNSTFSKYAT